MSTKSSRVEDRVNRVRQALNSQLLDTGASAPLLSEEAVVVVVAAEARRSRELANKLGPRAYLLAHDSHYGSNGGGRKVSETNKTFLQNTIRSVESHNRREQIDSAWRQHGLLRKLDRGELLTSNGNSQQGPLSARSGSSSNDLDAGCTRRSRSRSSSESHSGSGEVQEDREGSRRPRAASGHNGKHARVSGGDDEDNRASGRTANGHGREDGAEPNVSKEQNGAGDSKLRGLDAVEERAVWAARKARAFSATHSASAVGHESSSTEPGELKEYKLPPGYGARAGHDSDSSTDSDDSTRRGKDSKRKRKKEKKHKHHKRDKSDKHHKKSHKRGRADSEDASKSRKKAKS